MCKVGQARHPRAPPRLPAPAAPPRQTTAAVPLAAAPDAGRSSGSVAPGGQVAAAAAAAASDHLVTSCALLHRAGRGEVLAGAGAPDDCKLYGTLAPSSSSGRT